MATSMILPKKELEDIRSELASCKRPMYFFHDDADGVGSFLLLYRRVGEGQGVIVKTNPRVSTQFIRKVKEYGPDKIFITDLAMVDQDFIDEVKLPIVWIDHHTPQVRQGAKYFNPRVHHPDRNIPASRVCYEAVQEDLWIATVGTTADWVLDKTLHKKFCKAHPGLSDPDLEHVEDVLQKTELGRLITIIGFVLKGTASEALKYVKVLTRIKSPEEILRQESAPGTFIYRRYEEISRIYERLKKDSLASKVSDDVLVFIYEDNLLSLTKDLANDLLLQNPQTVVVIGRRKDDEVKMSLRAPMFVLPPVLERSLLGIDGYGGGHEHACGCCVKVKDYDRFLAQFRTEVAKAIAETKRHK